MARVDELLSPSAADGEIVVRAREVGRTILTQDLDFSAIIALSGRAAPSLITLRLSSSRLEYVNQLLERILPGLEQDVLTGMMVTVEDRAIRRCQYPSVAGSSEETSRVTDRSGVDEAFTLELSFKSCSGRGMEEWWGGSPE